MSTGTPMKDWHCEKHGTRGWNGEHCRDCAKDQSDAALCMDVIELKRATDWPTSAPAERHDHYRPLREVLMRALDQAAKGKGAQRHGLDLPITEQPMLTISRLVGTNRGLIYQALKKAQESTRMDKGAAIRELLGAINYLAGAIIYLEADHGQ